MKRAIISAIAILSIAYLSGCGGPTTYLSPNFGEYQSAHKTVAILPFAVTIDAKKLPKDYTLEMAKNAEKEEGYNLQREIYLRFLDRQQKGEYTVSFQDIDKTNALLSQANLKYEDMGTRLKSEVCRALNVDAVISGSVYRERPMSTGLAVGLGVLFGAWGSTNKVNVKVDIHEASNGDVVWKYDHEASGSVGSSSEKLAESLMKNISKKFPYKQKKD